MNTINTVTSTQSLLVGYEIKIIKTRRTERGDLLSYFLERMNPERLKGGYKVWTIKQLGYFLSIFRTGDLYSLRMKCDRANKFGVCFNYFVFSKKQIQKIPVKG